MSTIYENPALIDKVQQRINDAYLKLNETEKALLATVFGQNGPLVEEVLKHKDFKNTEESMMQKALLIKVKSWFAQEAKKANIKDEQTDFVSKMETKKKEPVARLKKLHVVYVKDAIYTNKQWTSGITAKALAQVRVGLANFSTFSSCFVYYEKKPGSNEIINYTAKLVNGPNGTKIVKFISI